MTTKKITFLLVFLSVFGCVFAQKADKQKKDAEKVFYVKIETSFGDMVVKLYNETPRHRDNFLNLVKEGTYNDLLFHRVINNFMIQGGDPNSKDAKPGQMLGDGGLDYTIPAEIVPGFYHKKGALAAARQGDDVNPQRESSSCQFYLVQGNVWTLERLKQMEVRMGKQFNEEQVKIYSTVGGTPWLDGEYTVFGEIVEGLDVVDKIAALACDRMNRPIQDVKMRMTIIEK